MSVGEGQRIEEQPAQRRREADALEAIHRLAETMALAQGLDEILEAALDAVEQALGVTRAAMVSLGRDGTVRFNSWRRLSEAYRAAVDGRAPWKGHADSPEPLVVDDVLADPEVDYLHEAFRTEGVRSMALVPLVHAGVIRGRLVMYSERPGAFDALDIGVAVTLASQVAAAIERRHAVDELLESRSRLEAIFASVADGITAQDASGRLVFANDAAAQLCGFDTAEDLIAAPPQSILERFELLDEDGAPLPFEELPGRIALATGSEAERLLCYRVRATGDRRWSVVRATPLAGPDGTPSLAINVFHDVTETKAAEERLRFLGEVSAALAASLDVDETLRAVAKLTVPDLADYCLIDLLDDEGRLGRVIIEHADPAGARILQEIRERFPPVFNEAHPATIAVRTAEPVLYPEVTQDVLEAAAMAGEHLDLYRRLEPSSYLVMPFVARGRVLGTISLGTGTSKRRFGPEDVALAREVADRAAVALENAMLHRTASESLAQLETVLLSAQAGVGFWDTDLRFLRVNEALAEMNGMPADEHVGKTLREVVPELADSLEPLYRQVIESGEPIVHQESTEHDPTRLGGDRHWLSSYFPIRSPAGEITGIGAVILEITERERAQARLRFLAQATEMLSGSLDLGEMLSRLVHLVVKATAEGAAVFLEQDGMLVRAAYAHDDPQLEAALAGATDRFTLRERSSHPLVQAFRRGVAELLPAVEAETVDDDLSGRLAPRSLIFAPLVGRERTIGILALWAGRPHALGAEELETAVELARRVGTAVENARLFAETEFQRALLERQGEASIDGMLVVGADASILYLNDRFREIWQIPDEAIARGDDAALEAALERVEDPEAFIARVRDVYTRREATREDLRFRDGRTIERYGAPVTASDGSYLGYLWSFRDITERMRAQEALRESEERFRAVFEQTTGGIAQTDLAGRFVLVNDRFCEIVARSREELLELSMQEISHPDDLAEDLRGFRALAEGRADSFAIEKRYVRPDGSPVWVRNHVSAIRDRDGRTRTIVAAVTDISDRKAAERELERRAEAAEALEFVGDGVFLVDRGGRIRLWNPSAERITGVAAADVVGRPSGEVLAGWPLDDLGERAETRPVETGGRELWLSFSAVASPEGTVYAFRDLTEERALEQLKTDFVSTVSHELRTPLAAIYGAAMTLQRADVALADEQRAGLLEVVAGESDRLARIVNDILWASRLDSGMLDVALESCDAAVLAKAVVTAARVHLPAAIELDLVLPPELPSVAADPDKARQVLVNLVDNAIKYSPDGGLVQVSVEDGGHVVRFSVSDRGLGIPSAEHARIFEKFFRLDPNLTRGVGGTGLGLYICRELVRRMGGRIWVESEEGAGSTFAFELPVAGS